MKYRALLVDIDGTILEHGQREITKPTFDKMKELQQNGTKVVIATGRTIGAVTDEMLRGFKPDFFVCANGATVLNNNQEVMKEDTLSLEHMQNILDYFSKMEDTVLGFSFDDAYYIYKKSDEYNDFYNNHSDEYTYFVDGSDQTRHLKSLPYTAWGVLEQEKAKDFNKSFSDLSMLHFSDRMFDITQAHINKKTGTDFLLEHLGMNWEEIVFVGDGDNDLEILAAAGLGVAMGNGNDRVKKAAKVVTDSVQEDGVAKVIDTYFFA